MEVKYLQATWYLIREASAIDMCQIVQCRSGWYAFLPIKMMETTQPSARQRVLSGLTDVEGTSGRPSKSQEISKDTSEHETYWLSDIGTKVTKRRNALGVWWVTTCRQRSWQAWMNSSRGFANSRQAGCGTSGASNICFGPITCNATIAAGWSVSGFSWRPEWDADKHYVGWIRSNDEASSTDRAALWHSFQPDVGMAEGAYNMVLRMALKYFKRF